MGSVRSPVTRSRAPPARVPSYRLDLIDDASVAAPSSAISRNPHRHSSRALGMSQSDECMVNARFCMCAAAG